MVDQPRRPVASEEGKTVRSALRVTPRGDVTMEEDWPDRFSLYPHLIDPKRTDLNTTAKWGQPHGGKSPNEELFSEALIG